MEMINRAVDAPVRGKVANFVTALALLDDCERSLFWH
jgi:hypothetical protein